MARDVPSGGSGDGDSGIPNLAAVKEMWNMWEIHVMIILSLFLQVILFFFAGLRRRNSSSIWRALLSLAYLSADAVAVFALGHLVVHAEGPRHHLMYFWAPFVLVHLGGQDTITALSKQDNELWRRHLLNLVMQVAMAAYVVAKASWPDPRLRAAMVIMFLNGCFKYAERTLCLYISSPLRLISSSVDRLDWTLRKLKMSEGKGISILQAKHEIESAIEGMHETLDMMLKGSRSCHRYGIVTSIMSEDAPRSIVETILIADQISGMLAKFKSRAGRCGAYKYVGACLVKCHQRLHTKAPLREALHRIFWGFMEVIDDDFGLFEVLPCMLYALIVLYIVFHHVSAPIALVLFMAAEKGDQHHTSRADVTVSYILLVGALILDACSFFSSLRYLPKGRIKNVVLRVANCIQPAGSRKQWSEELAQYNMIRHAHTLQSSGAIQRFGKRLAFWFGFGTTTHIPVTKYHTPIKEVVLDNLLCLGATNKWNITTSRGKLALQKWRNNHQTLDSGNNLKKVSALEVLQKSITVDFPISVLIWHIATDMCYYHEDNSTDEIDDHMNGDNKQVSRELSNYIMYLVFKCGVKRTTSSQLLHIKADREIRDILRHKLNRGENNAVRGLFEHKEVVEYSSTEEIQEQDTEQDSVVIEIPKPEELIHPQDSMAIETEKPKELDEEQQISTVSEIPKPEELIHPQDSMEIETEKPKEFGEEQQISMVSEIPKPEELIHPQDSMAIETEKPKELDEEQQISTVSENWSGPQNYMVIELPEELDKEEQESTATEIQKHGKRADSNPLKLVQENLEDVNSPVLPRAREVARELISIKDVAERWHLIAEVWLEMLYYVAPVCGVAFHYDHLSTGGEFVTHVLLLMQLLGPFLPPPSA